jgi:hypothetical protein
VALDDPGPPLGGRQSRLPRADPAGANSVVPGEAPGRAGTPRASSASSTQPPSTA